MLNRFSARRRRFLGGACLALLGSMPALAQLPTSVDIDLVAGPAANQLDVRMRANTNSFNEVLSGLTFTIRWVDTSPATLTAGTSPWCTGPSFPIAPSTMVTPGNGFKYRTYNSIATVALWDVDNGGCDASLPVGVWTTVHRINVSGNTGCVEFQIVNDTYTGANNRNFFVSLNGQQGLAGTIEPTSVLNGNCAADCAGVIGGTASIDGCGVCSGGTTGITPRTPASGTFSYSGSPYCSNAGTASVTTNATAGGTYSSTAGLSLNSTTGDVTLGTSTPGTYTVTYTVAAYGTCPQYQTTAQITISGVPTTSNAGPDQTVCGTGATLAANAASVGTGAWSIVSGAGGSFGNSASNTSSFTGVAGTTYTLRWTISNAPCTASTDDVVITLVANPTTANAGPDQTVCGTGATLAANAASVGTGAWSIVSGAGGSFGNSASRSEERRVGKDH